jgi:hypothetical protein
MGSNEQKEVNTCIRFMVMLLWLRFSAAGMCPGAGMIKKKLT